MKPKRRFVGGLAGLSLAVLIAPQIEAGPIIEVGPYTPPLAHSTVFVVPIEILAAVELMSWQFDLRFDPSDVRINVGCNPLTDSFCDPFNGPVTEGPFFSSRAQFPTLFVPGFIITDLAGDQTGALLGVAGAWQDPPPGPSGDGILAYVEFITTTSGTGASTVTVTGTSTSSAAPEPTTLALLAAGLALLCGRSRPSRGRRLAPPADFPTPFSLIGGTP